MKSPTGVLGFKSRLLPGSVHRMARYIIPLAGAIGAVQLNACFPPISSRACLAQYAVANLFFHMSALRFVRGVLQGPVCTPAMSEKERRLAWKKNCTLRKKFGLTPLVTKFEMFELQRDKLYKQHDWACFVGGFVQGCLLYGVTAFYTRHGESTMPMGTFIAPRFEELLPPFPLTSRIVFVLRPVIVRTWWCRVILSYGAPFQTIAPRTMSLPERVFFNIGRHTAQIMLSKLCDGRVAKLICLSLLTNLVALQDHDIAKVYAEGGVI